MRYPAAYKFLLAFALSFTPTSCTSEGGSPPPAPKQEPAFGSGFAYLTPAERQDRERRAAEGDGDAGYGLYLYYAFVTNDRNRPANDTYRSPVLT